MATLTEALREWTLTGAFDRDDITYKANPSDVIDTMSVTWPDGSTGVFTTTDFVSVDYTNLLTGYRMTHESSGLVVLQRPLRLNALGVLVDTPPLLIIQALSLFGAVPFGSRPFGL